MKWAIFELESNNVIALMEGSRPVRDEIPNGCGYREAHEGEQCTPVEIVRDHNQKLNDIRRMRNRLLSQTDWTQLPDGPSKNKLAWQQYRQQLRDITDNITDIDNIDWPETP